MGIPRRDSSALAAVHSSRGLVGHADQLARSNPRDSCQGCRNQWTKVFKGSAGCNEDNDTNASPSQVLLEFQILICGDKDVEPPVRRALKQLSVLQSRPALLL